MTTTVALKAGPILAILPRADHPSPSFGGFVFCRDATPPQTAGVYIFTRRIGDVLYPAFIGEDEDVAVAIETFRSQQPSADIDGCFWMVRPQPRQRTHIARDLVGKYHPPLNIEHRKGPAAPAIAALIPDRYAAADASASPPLPADSIVATEQELGRLVQAFYAAARADPVIGPVFNRSVSDWDAHAAKVQDFWSRTILGTKRYDGMPFTPHLFLGLKPEHFDSWVALFKATATEVLRPEAAAFAIGKVEHMSRCFQTGLFLPPIEAKAG
jgi:truncated hemoglobin YjbI